MDEAKRIAFEHYGFDEEVLGPFFDQADEDENGHLDPVEFAGFRTVIRARAVKNAIAVISEVDLDGDGLVNFEEAAEKTKAEDDMEPHETKVLFNIADQVWYIAFQSNDFSRTNPVSWIRSSLPTSCVLFVSRPFDSQLTISRNSTATEMEPLPSLNWLN